MLASGSSKEEPKLWDYTVENEDKEKYLFFSVQMSLAGVILGTVGRGL
jgi:hypothetical protein